MNQNVKYTIKEIQALVKAWRFIQQDYSDCEQKDAALDIINELLIGKCEELADWCKEIRRLIKLKEMTGEERRLLFKKFAEELNKMRDELLDFQSSAADCIDKHFVEEIEEAYDKLDVVALYVGYYLDDNDKS